MSPICALGKILHLDGHDPAVLEGRFVHLADATGGERRLGEVGEELAQRSFELLFDHGAYGFELHGRRRFLQKRQALADRLG
jgi:hypothetical protein